MANQPYSGFPTATSATTDDYLALTDNPGGTPVSKKITFDNLQKSITAVGTLTTGTWNATAIADAYISSAATWNAKQDALAYTPEDIANKSTNTSLGTSDTLYPTQKAVKTYVDAHIGSGDVVGPASATDGAIPLFDTTTGKLLKDSAYTPTSFDVSGAASSAVSTHEGTFNHAHYDTAYGWGNHATAGYLTSLTGAVLTDQSTPQTIGTTGARLAKLWVTDITLTNSPIIGTLTAGRVTYAGASKELVDSANLLFDGTYLSLSNPANRFALGTSASAGFAMLIQPTFADTAGSIIAYDMVSTSGDASAYYGFAGRLSVSSGKTVASHYGAYLFNPIGSGTVTNNYGLYIPSQTKGATGNYPIYFAGTSATGADNAIWWTTDTKIYRSAASTLKTDGAFIIGGTATIGTLSGLLKGASGVVSAATADVDYTTPTGVETMTNKRVTKRVGATTSSATPTINTDNYDEYTITAQAAAITSFTTNLSGTPTEGQALMIRIKDDGTARAITWGTSFRGSTSVPLPTTTTLSKTLYVGLMWNATDSKWDCLATSDGY